MSFVVHIYRCVNARWDALGRGTGWDDDDDDDCLRRRRNQEKILSIAQLTKNTPPPLTSAFVKSISVALVYRIRIPDWAPSFAPAGGGMGCVRPVLLLLLGLLG